MSRIVNFSVCIAIVLLSGCANQEKLVDKSERKPKWVKTDETDLVKIKVKSPTLFEAKNKANDSFKKTLINAIVKLEDASGDSSKLKVITKFVSEYQWSDIKGESHKKVQGMHDTLMIANYWEKQKLSNGGYLFTYYGLYDVTKEEIEKMASQYHLRYNHTGELIAHISEGMYSTNSIDTLLNFRQKLFELEVKSGLYFQEEIHQTKKQLDEIINSITVQVIAQTPKKIVFEVITNGQKTKLNSGLKVRSNCAKIESLEVSDFSCTVLFDTKYCIQKDNQNSIDINLNTSKNPIIIRSIKL